MKKISDELYHEKDALKGNEMPTYIRRKEIYHELDIKKSDTKKNESALKNLKIELENLQKNLQNEVSCIAFHPNQPYIAVGLNNKTKNVSSRFVIYDPSVKTLYYIIPDDYSPRNQVNVLMASFSSHGDMFAYTTCRFNDNDCSRGVLRVQNFYTVNQELKTSEKRVYEIPNRSVTCITPYKSTRGFHDGSRYSSHGIMMTHEFLIGCDDGSLRLINVITVQPSQIGEKIRIEEFISVKEWNGGRDKITCLAIHPLLPLSLFASGSGDAVKLWAFESNKELETLPLQPASPLSCVGFNDKFLAVCGSGDVRVYSCNSDDYGGFKQKKLERKERLDKLHDELREKTLKGQCAICLKPMTSQSQPSITSGPEEVVETYLPCNHKFHEKCIKRWLKEGGNTCPECRANGGLPQPTPAKVVTKRSEELAEREKELNETDESSREARRALFAAPASDQSGVAATELMPQNQSGGRKKNKLKKSKKSKKSKKRNYYSKKIKNK
jgi:hypothetical protein